ncbi:MAG: RNA methyltransferase [Bacteroidales bacterium]
MQKTTNSSLNRLSTEEFIQAKKLPVWVILDNVRSQNNTGSIFRSCDAFRIEGIVLCGITATPPHREIHKTALGAEDSVAWTYEGNTVSAVNKFKAKGYRIIAVEQAEGSVSLETFLPLQEKLVFVFGNEINGVADEVMNLVDSCVEIPQFGTKHSINIAVSAGIILWEVFKKAGGFNLFGLKKN